MTREEEINELKKKIEILELKKRVQDLERELSPNITVPPKTPTYSRWPYTGEAVLCSNNYC